MLEIDYITYGEHVHAARRRKRLTQRDVAQHLGISASHLSDIERGEAKPSYAVVMSLCAFLDVAEPPDRTVEAGEV